MQLSRPVSVLLAASVLVGGANLAAYAATGGSFILGQTNKANKPSLLVNTATGPALKLKSDEGAPAFTVSNGNKIAKLNADQIDGLDSAAFALQGHAHDDRYYLETEIDSLLGEQRFVRTGNGVGNNFGCATGLGVQVTNGRGEVVDDRFTFQVPGASAEAWGQIRSDGSVRTGSANVTGADHPSAGVYCVQFTSTSGMDLEGAVVAMHLN